MLRILTGVLAPDKPELESTRDRRPDAFFFNRKPERACVFGKL
jgi:hypothetical protein